MADATRAATGVSPHSLGATDLERGANALTAVGDALPAAFSVARQDNMHVSEATQRPAELQVWTAVPMQRLAPGLQSPVQAPFEHTAAQAVMLCHLAF